MKKMLSFVLTIAIIVSMFAATSVAAVEDVAVYPTISLDEEKVVVSDGEVNNGEAIFSFVPVEDDTYCFYSFGSDVDTYGYLFDENMNEITRDDDSGKESNFKIEYSMTAGTQYYLKSRPFSIGDIGNYSVRIAKLVPATSIEIDYDEIYEGYVGDEFGLGVEFAPENSLSENYTWTSDNSEVASVNSDGNIVLNAAGTAVITAISENGLSDSITVNATERVKAESVELNYGSNITGYIGETIEFSAQLKPQDCLYEEFTWSSDNISVVSVDDNGYAKCLISGTATITVTTESGLTDSCTIEVKEATPIFEGEEIILNTDYDAGMGCFSFVPETDDNYVFYSFDNDFDTYGYLFDENMNEIKRNDDGGIENNFRIEYSMTAGTQYYLKAEPYSSGNEGKYSIIVAKLVPATSIEITYEDESFEGYVGEDIWLDVVFGPENSISQNYTWTSDNSEVASVNIEGIVEFKAGGTAVITVTSENGLSDSITIIVTERPKATTMTIEGAEDKEYVGSSNELWVAFYPEDAKTEEITWSSSDENIATIDEYGHVEYLSEGTVIITAESENGLIDTCTITVKEYPIFTLENPLQVEIIKNQEEWIKFTPSKSGAFRIYGTDLPEGHYLSFTVLDSSWNVIAEAYGRPVDCEFEADETYYIVTWFSGYIGSGSVTFNLNAAELVPATSITLDIGTEYEGFINEEFDVNVIFAPEFAFIEYVEWSSSDESVVEVYDGYVHLASKGEATITAITESGLKASCKITVKDYETITLNTDKTVLIHKNKQTSSHYYFTPEKDGYYSFHSYATEFDTVGSIYDSDFNELYWDDDSGEGGNFNVRCYLEAGVTYILKTRLYSEPEVDGSYKIRVEETKCVTALEIISMPKKTEYIKDFVYGYIRYDGLKLKATWSDGTTSVWKYNGNTENIDGAFLTFDSEEVEETSCVNIICDEATVKLPITIIEGNPVDHLEVVSYVPTRYYIENYGGNPDWNENGEFYHYNVSFPNEAQIEIFFKDGTSTIANVGEYIDGYYIGWDENQYENPWTVGNDNKSTVSYLGHEVNLPITVKANTVEKIEVVSGKITLTHEANGYNDNNYYHYRYDMPNDVKIKITYTFGSSKTVNIHSYVDGYAFNWDDDQFNEHWTLGDDNYVTVSYLGKQARLPVSIVKNSVTSIEINNAPTREYVFGDTMYGYLSSGVKYYLENLDFTGLTFTAYYDNGTSKVFAYNDMDDDELNNITWHGVEAVTEPGNVTVKFEYMGRTAEFTAKIKEPTATSIAVTKKPEKTVYDSEYFYPEFIGTEFTITYNNGTKKVVEVTDSNSKWDTTLYSGEFSTIVEVDSESIVILYSYEYNEITFVAYYQNVRCVIDDIEFNNEKIITSVELENVTYNGDGMKIKLTYDDSTSEVLTLDMIEFIDYKDLSGYGLGKTEKGFLPYYIIANIDENGKVDSYYIYILEEEMYVEAKDFLVGDCNGDRDVNSTDLAVMKLHLAGLNELSAIGLQGADLNGDGTVNTTDLAELKLKLAGLK